MYTDGSKDGSAVASPSLCGSRVLLKRLPNNSSIFSAEARAILLSPDAMERSSNDRFLLVTDSMSCLQSIENHKLNHPLVLEIVVRVRRLLSDGKQLVFMWLPSHVGIAGNSAVDAAAKAVLNLPESTIVVP